MQWKCENHCKLNLVLTPTSPLNRTTRLLLLPFVFSSTGLPSTQLEATWCECFIPTVRKPFARLGFLIFPSQIELVLPPAATQLVADCLLLARGDRILGWRRRAGWIRPLRILLGFTAFYPQILPFLCVFYMMVLTRSRFPPNFVGFN